MGTKHTAEDLVKVWPSFSKFVIRIRVHAVHMVIVVRPRLPGCVCQTHTEVELYPVCCFTSRVNFLIGENLIESI